LNNVERIDLRQWSKFVSELETFNYSMARLKLKFEILDSTAEFAQANGLPFLAMDLGDMFAKIHALDMQAKAINAAYAYTQSLAAGARPSASYPGDFDIVVKEGNLTPEQISAASVNLDALNKPPFTLGVAPFVIWAGVAVVALVVGAIATVSIMSAKETELETEIDRMQLELENKIADRPELLQPWTDYKMSQQGQARGIIDDLLGTGASKRILGGAGGIAVLIVGAWIAMQFFKKGSQPAARGAK